MMNKIWRSGKEWQQGYKEGYRSALDDLFWGIQNQFIQDLNDVMKLLQTHRRELHGKGGKETLKIV